MHRINGNIIFEAQPRIASQAAVVGKKEREGPLGKYFDNVLIDSYAGKDSFEQAESELMRQAVDTAIGGLETAFSEVDIAFCGDLLNQCVASSFAMSGFGIPYAGIYGACSTMGLGLIMASAAAESGAARRALCAASSHYCTAERQYRTPLEYGSQRPPTAQWTVTGAGACVVEAKGLRDIPTSAPNEPKSPDTSAIPYVHSARIGRIIDYSVTDQNNMGAAMAPAVVNPGT